MSDIERVCRAICESRKFECGQGCCAPICMENLGVARDKCQRCVLVHGELARAVIEAIREPSFRMAGEGDALMPLRTDVPSACAIWRAMVDAILKEGE